MSKSEATRVRLSSTDRENLDSVRAWLARAQADPALTPPSESEAIRVALRVAADFFFKKKRKRA